jgi:DNA-directed RNA polymerase specialized sigma54-like protein
MTEINFGLGFNLRLEHRLEVKQAIALSQAMVHLDEITQTLLQEQNIWISEEHGEVAGEANVVLDSEMGDQESADLAPIIEERETPPENAASSRKDRETLASCAPWLPSEEDENWGRKGVESESETERWWEEWSASPNMEESLSTHSRLVFMNQKDRQIAEFIIGCLDEEGELINRDCDGDPTDTIAEVADQFDMSRHHVESIASTVQAAVRDVQRDLQAWVPQNTSWTSDVIEPDVIAAEIDHSFAVYLNPRRMPTLRLVPIPEQLRAMKRDAEIRRLLSERRQARQGLRLIRSGRQTLLQVSESVVQRQEPCLKYGFSHLKPLTQEEVGQQIGIDPSYVSRIIKGRYLQIPQGVYPLEVFFCRKFSGENENTKVQILRSILGVITDEDPHRPLSDEHLASLLKERNLEIAGRTVCKYRDMLGIPSARNRRNASFDRSRLKVRSNSLGSDSF